MLEDQFQQFERLPNQLNEEIAQFTPELKASLADFAMQAADRGKTEVYAARLDALERKRGAMLWGDYLAAQISIQANHLEEWEKSLLRLADRLSQSHAWEQARLIGEEILEAHPSAAAARLVLRAVDAVGDPERLPAALEQAWALDPGNPQVALRLAARAAVRGEKDEALEWQGAALKGLVEFEDWPGLDEVMLAVLAGDEASSQQAAIEAIGMLFHAGDEKKATEYLELGSTRWLSGPPHNAHLLGMLRTTADRGDGGAVIRPALVAALRSMHRRFPQLEEFLTFSGLASPGAQLPQALAAWDELWAYRPGMVVEHGSLGLGIIQKNDGTRLQIRFPSSPEHSMTLSFAQKSLTLLPEQHLKSQIARNREGTLARFAAEPAEMLAHALQDLGGTAKNTDLKKYLTHIGFPASSFAAWWKKAKAAAAGHPRLDDHEAYREVMHLVEEGGGGERRMPMLDPKKGPKAAVTLVNRFLAQHPGALDEAKRRYAPYFESWAAREDLPPVERTSALLLLARWFPERTAEWGRLAADLDPDLVEAPSWNVTQDQELWLLLLAHDSRWAARMLPFLGSRKAEVRVMARNELAARWGDRLENELGRLLERSTELPSVTVALAMEALNERELPSWSPPWRIAVSLISVLEEKSEESVSKEALRMLDPEEGRLVTLVRQAGLPDEDLSTTLQRLLRHWRSSDRYLFPVLEFLKASPAAPMAEDAEKHRAAELSRIQVNTGDTPSQSDHTLMTRHTFDRMVRELERLNRDLKTVIPQAIRKARELGDLRENAEYDAAKLKQRQTTQRCEKLEAAVRQVRLIEDLDISEESAGPGTELRLRGPQGERVVWILGEGDNHLGEEVVSYRAPLGKSLVGRKVGDRVTLKNVDGETEAEYEVLEIRKRIPPPPPPEPTISSMAHK